jgi:DNA topoisomerase-1
MVAQPVLSEEPVAKVNPVDSARQAGLRYVSDTAPGIRRKRRGGKFNYFAPDGSRITDAEELARIRSLAIPPAWTDVWICANARGHLQATGRDARGRKQYRYHPKWRAVRDETKYERMVAFGEQLPKIREQTGHDLALRGLPRRKVLAAVVRLLETTLIRVGNEEYARDNKSFGLTTMRDRHVEFEGQKVQFHFKGKSGKKHLITLKDRRLAKVVRRCRDIPGQELFQYIDDDGQRETIDSADVNAYLQEITGQQFTAKDFRTWAGTVLASLALQEFESFDSQAQAKKNVLRAIESVAERLGNTPTVCRKCYIHPAVLDSYLEGTMLETLQQRTEDDFTERDGELRPEEAAVLGLLRRRLAEESVSDAKKSAKPQSLKAALRASLKQARKG